MWPVEGAIGLKRACRWDMPAGHASAKKAAQSAIRRREKAPCRGYFLRAINHSEFMQMVKTRSFARFFGVLLLMGAIGGVGYEIFMMVNTGVYRVVSLAELWTVAHRPSIDLVRNSLDNGTWNLLLATYLGWPNWAALSLPGVILLILGLGQKDDGTVLRVLPGR